jgi:membrane protease YdiL (CAAX protease family)
VTTGLNRNNRLLTLARQGQHPPSVLAAVAVVPVLLALLIVSQVAARVLLRPIFQGRVGSVADPIAEIIGFLSIFVGLWVLLRFWSKRPFSSLGFEYQNSFPRVVRGALIAGLMVGAMAGLAMVPGATLSPGELRTKGLTALGAGSLSLLATCVQSSAEEALFRGWLLPAIALRYGPVTGVIVSSLVFTIAHATSAPTPLGFLNLFLFGTFAAMRALAEGGLWGASAWHTVWNWAEGGLLGMVVDRSANPGLLVSIRTAGPDFITGGAFGPEGGVAATAVLLIGICFTVMQTRKVR